MDKTDGDSLWIEQVERLPLAPVLSCKYEQDLMRPVTRFGPEISFGLALNEQWPERKFVILKRAVSGSSLATDWARSRQTADTGYGALVNDLVQIRAAYQPRRVIVAGLLWLQGETDSKDKAMAAAYGANLHSFISHLRADIVGWPFPVVIAGLPDYGCGTKYGCGHSAPGAGAVGGHGHYYSDVERGFKDAERTLPPLEYLPNDGHRTSRNHLPTGQEEAVTTLGDDKQICSHYSSTAQIRIGARAANAFARMGGQHSASWPTGSWLSASMAGPASSAPGHRTLYDWFWQKEKVLLANLPDVSKLDPGDTCKDRF